MFSVRTLRKRAVYLFPTCLLSNSTLDLVIFRFLNNYSFPDENTSNLIDCGLLLEHAVRLFGTLKGRTKPISPF